MNAYKKHVVKVISNGTGLDNKVVKAIITNIPNSLDSGAIDVEKIARQITWDLGGFTFRAATYAVEEVLDYMSDSGAFYDRMDETSKPAHYVARVYGMYIHCEHWERRR